MAKKLIVNGIQCDLNGSERMPVTYQASPIAELPAAQGNFSVEFNLPYTATNRKAFDLPDDLPNNSRTPFRLLPAQFTDEGVDMKIDSCQLVSVQRLSGIKVRLFGGFTSLLNLISKKSIQDCDLSSLDHDRTFANVNAALQGTSGYIYPLINYLDDISGDDVKLESLYPSVYLHTVVDQMLDDVGYSMTGDLVDDDEYKSVLLPFSNKQGEYSAALLAAIQSKFYLESPLTLEGTAIPGRNFSLSGEASDDFDLVWDDPFPKYHALIRATYEFNAKVTIFGTPSANVTVYLLRQSAASGYTVEVPVVGTIDAFPEYDILNSWNVQGTDFASGMAVIDETTTHELNRGDKVWLAFSKSVVQATFDDGASVTFLEITDVTNYGIFIGDKWQVAPNLPDIKQTDLLKWIIQAFSCIVEVDNDKKELRLTKFSNVVNNYNRVDWSDKLDLNLEPELSFPLELAQSNEVRYQDDENIIKPEGADYVFTVENKNLEEEAVFYEAPFGVTLTVEEFTDTQDVPRIDILSNQLKPRILIYKAVTLSTGVDLTLAGVPQSTVVNVSVPYFIEPGQAFNLGWSTNLIPKYSTDRLKILTSPRVLVGLFRLTPSDINQLDFRKPIWIDRYKSYFYLIRVRQYESGKSTTCELLQL